MMLRNSLIFGTIELVISYKIFPLTYEVSYDSTTLLIHFSTSSTLLVSYDSHSLQYLHLYELYWPKILKLSLFSISWPSSLTTPLIMFLLLLNIHPMYFVLTLLNRKPLDSKVSHQISNLPLTLLLVSSTKTISSANSIHQRTSSWIDLVSSSITSAKRYGLSIDPWCKLLTLAKRK